MPVTFSGELVRLDEDRRNDGRFSQAGAAILGAEREEIFGSG
jgi:hypothetical protein